MLVGMANSEIVTLDFIPLSPDNFETRKNIKRRIVRLGREELKLENWNR
jgi:hypothetical protein